MWYHSKPKPAECILFWSYLKHFLGAGLPLVLAFHHLARVFRRKPWPGILQRIESNLLSGKKLAASLAAEKHIFNDDVIAMIKIAEQKGNYPEIIDMIIDHQKWQLQTQQTIRSALRYPLILLGIMGGLFYIILNQIVPQLRIYLASLGIEDLPIATRILIQVSEIAPYVLILLVSCGGIVFLTFKGRWDWLKAYRCFFERCLIHVPGVGHLYDRLVIIAFVRVLAILLDSGVDLLVSLHQAIKVVSSSWRAEQLSRGKDQLIQGEKLSMALKEVLKHYPALGMLFDLGEKTGRLPAILIEYVTFEMGQFRGEVDRRVQGLQPLLIMIMGTILIWVVISILLPIYDQMNVSGIQ